MRTHRVESEALSGESRKQELIARIQSAIGKWRGEHGELYGAANAQAIVESKSGHDIAPIQLSVKMNAGRVRKLQRLLVMVQHNEYSEREVEETLRGLESGSA